MSKRYYICGFYKAKIHINLSTLIYVAIRKCGCFGMGVFSLVTTDQIVANIFETTHIEKSYKKVLNINNTDSAGE